MSQDYKNTKPHITTGYPEGSTILSGEGVAGFDRVEGWLTPDRLRNEFLFGIPLTSTTTKQTMSDDLLKVIIRRAAAHFEVKTKVTVTPQQKFDRIEFDRTKYLQGWNQLQLKYGNVLSVEECAIRAVNSTNVQNGVNYLNPPTPNPQVVPNQEEGSTLYIVPLAWLDMSYANKGLLHFVPLQTTFSSWGCWSVSWRRSAIICNFFTTPVDSQFLGCQVYCRLCGEFNSSYGKSIDRILCSNGNFINVGTYNSYK